MASFFHKYQRPLMLGLAFFALITFSVTGAMMVFFSRCFGGVQGGLPRLVLQDGTKYQVTFQDYDTAQDVFQLFVERFPLLDLGFDKDENGSVPEEEKKHAFDRVLILYCAAKAAGIGVTDGVIQDFIHSPIAQYYWQVKDQESYERVVYRFFRTSLPKFEKAFIEFKRIQFYIQTLASAENLSVLSVLEEARKAGEVFQVEYVPWLEEDFEKQLKKKKITDKEILAFLEGLPEGEKAPFLERKVVDLEVAWVGKETNPASLEEAVKKLKPSKGSPGARFLEGLPKKLKAVTDAEISRFYDANKDRLYKLKEPASKPASKPASQPASKPAVKKYRPLDNALKAEIRRVLELEKAVDLVFAEAKKQGRQEGRKFDLKAFLEKYFLFIKILRTGLKPAAGLEKVPVLKGWSEVYSALAPAAGEFVSKIQSSEKALFFARVAQVKENVPRELKEIRKDLLDLYYKKESKKLAEKAAKDFIQGLRVLGRKANPKGVEKIRGEIEKAVGKRVAALEKELKAEIGRFEKVLRQKDLPGRVVKLYKEALKKKKAELAAFSEKRKKIQAEEEKKREEDLKKAELAKVGPSFRKFALSRKLKVVQVPPFPKNLHKIDAAALDLLKDDTLRFLEGREGVAKLEDLEKGRVSEVIEDPTSRTFLVVHMLDRHPKKAEDLTPAEVEEQVQKRKGDAPHKFVKKALSFEALRKRFHYTNYRGEKEKGEAGKTPKETPADPPSK